MATGVSRSASKNGSANKNSNFDSKREGKNPGLEDPNDVSVVLSDEDDDKKDQQKNFSNTMPSTNLKTIKKQ